MKRKGDGGFRIRAIHDATTLFHTRRTMKTPKGADS